MKEKMVVRIGKNTIILLLVIGLVELPFEMETSRIRFIVWGSVILEVPGGDSDCAGKEKHNASEFLEQMDIPEQKNLIFTSIKKNERVKAHFE